MCCSRMRRSSAASPGLRRAAIMAQEHNIVFTPHTWTNGMGVMANTQLVAGLGHCAVHRVPVRSAGVEPRSPRLHDGRAAGGRCATAG